VHHTDIAHVKHIVGESEDGSNDFFESVSPGFAEDSPAKLEGPKIRCERILQAEFEEKLAVLLDQAMFFTVEAMKDVAADEPIELVYFPIGSPDLNPTEEYWRRLKQVLGNRYFDSLNEIRSAV